MVDVPGLLELSDSLWENREQCNSRTLQELQRRHGQLRDRLQDWYQATGASIKLVVDKILTEDPQNTTGCDLGQIHLLVLYWCCLLFCVEVQTSIRTLEQLSTDADVPAADDVWVTCSDMIHVMPLFLGRHSGWLGVHLATFPLSVLQVYIRKFVGQSLPNKELGLLDQVLELPKGKRLKEFYTKIDWIWCQPRWHTSQTK